MAAAMTNLRPIDSHGSAMMEGVIAAMQRPARPLELVERLLDECFHEPDEGVSAIYRRAIHAAHVEHLALLRDRLRAINPTA